MAIVESRYYPDAHSYAVSVGEVNLPRVLESHLPKDTTHIQHDISLGSQSYVSESERVRYRKFRERRSPTTSPQGEKVSFAQYHLRMENYHVPLPPEENMWKFVAGLYIRALKRIVAVETAADQMRITSVNKKKKPGDSAIEVYRSVTSYVNRLEELQVPPEAFAYLDPNKSFKESATATAETLQLPLVDPLRRLANIPAQGLINYSLRRGADGEFTESVRTERNPL